MNIQTQFWQLMYPPNFCICPGPWILGVIMLAATMGHLIKYAVYLILNRINGPDDFSETQGNMNAISWTDKCQQQKYVYWRQIKFANLETLRTKRIGGYGKK